MFAMQVDGAYRFTMKVWYPSTLSPTSGCSPAVVILHPTQVRSQVMFVHTYARFMREICVCESISPRRFVSHEVFSSLYHTYTEVDGRVTSIRMRSASHS